MVNYACAAVSGIFGLIYLFNPTFMDYHKAALEKKWEELDKKLQTLILALMRAVSSGALLLAFIIIVLQDAYDNTGQQWIPLTILISSLILSSGSIYAMVLVTSRTKGRPPVLFVLLGLAMAIAAYLLHLQEISRIQNH